MRINNSEIFICILFSMFSCTPVKYSSAELTGEYVQKDNSSNKIILNKDNFTLINSSSEYGLALYKCCDTITYGIWEIEKNKGFLKYSSTDKFKTYHVSIYVEESTVNSKDSLYFFIDNPIEQHRKKYNEKYRSLNYRLEINCNNYKLSSEIPLKVFENNRICLVRPKGLKIESLKIQIEPNHDIGLREFNAEVIYTLPYKIKNFNSNKFEINLPELDFNYINHRRVNGDYIKVVDKNKLLWDGLEFIRVE